MNTLQLVLLLLGASVLVVTACRIANLPPILGYLLVGVVVGPHTLDLLPDAEGASHLAEFGVVFLMFSIGLEFSLPRLMAMKRIVFGLGFAQVVFTSIAIGAVAVVAAGVPWLVGVGFTLVSRYGSFAEGLPAGMAAWGPGQWALLALGAGTPVVFFFVLAALYRRTQEMRLVSRAMTEVALRLAEPEVVATDSVLSLSQTIRREVAAMGDGIERAVARAGELELDEDYVATIIEGGEPKPVISGGEEDIANLALRLAISQMIADRAGQALSLLVLDEIFGSLDEERRAAVVDLLRSLADRFPQVILITHIEGVREGMDRVVRVDLDGEHGVARVRDDLGGGTGDGLAA